MIYGIVQLLSGLAITVTHTLSYKHKVMFEMKGWPARRCCCHRGRASRQVFIAVYFSTRSSSHSLDSFAPPSEMGLKYSADDVAAARSLQTFTVIILWSVQATSDESQSLVHIQYVLLHL
jgi:hypothetical protein